MSRVSWELIVARSNHICYVILLSTCYVHCEHQDEISLLFDDETEAEIERWTKLKVCKVLPVPPAHEMVEADAWERNYAKQMRRQSRENDRNALADTRRIAQYCVVHRTKTRSGGENLPRCQRHMLIVSA